VEPGRVLVGNAGGAADEAWKYLKPGEEKTLRGSSMRR